MNINRRDILRLLGGSAVGFFLSPVPYKLLDDTAIWTQNWPWMPKPPSGPIQMKYSVCTLCPAGCGLRARCVGEQPVSLWGVADHPISRGMVCPMGMTAHHLPYHPLRLKQPYEINGNEYIPLNPPSKGDLLPITLEEAVADLANVIDEIKSSSEAIAVLDGQPGRTTSLLYRQFLASAPNGLYLATPNGCETLTTLQEMCEGQVTHFGYDFENTQTILSFGAPLLDGWGTPGRMLQLTKERANGERQLKLIQVETRQSHTALQADDWLPIYPGTEAALALGLANVIVREKLYDKNLVRKNSTDFDSYLKLIHQYTPEKVAGITGLTAAKIFATAFDIARNKPAVVIADGNAGGGPLAKEEQTAIAALNILLGCVGCEGGVAMRRAAPTAEEFQREMAPATDISAVAENSIRLLIIDAAESGCAIPNSLIEKKLAKDAVVVSLSPYFGELSRLANYLIPAPAFLESLQDTPPAIDARVASFSISTALFTPAEGATEPVTFLAKLAAAAGLNSYNEMNASGLEDFLRRRVEAIHQTGRGQMFVAESADYSNVSDISADEMWENLLAGGCWLDSEMGTKSLPKMSFLKSSKALEKGFVRVETSHEYPLLLIPYGWRGATANSQISPLMTKLFQESDLRPGASQAFINPETAANFNLVDGEIATITTRAGSAIVEIHFDETVMPDVIHVAVGPDPRGFDQSFAEENILSICELSDVATWRVTPAKLERV
jgi:anaerobic selenocysteine-containing dehydrogenase